MNVEFFAPKNKLLRQFIEGYYFILDDQSGGSERYWTFPNNYCIVTINLNANVECSENNIKIVPSIKANINTSVVYRYVNPIEIYYEKPINEITIYFKPLGLNHFVNSPDTIFSQTKSSDFTSSFTNFDDEMFKIFKDENRETQIERLEAFWLSKWAEKGLELMKSIVKDVESNLKIEDVAHKYQISRKHLNTLFLKHLGKPPGEYQKIDRFRKAIGNRKGIRNLTELAYENLFYDQSHLIKDFKALTKISPKIFFRDIDTEQKNVWLLSGR